MDLCAVNIKGFIEDRSVYVNDKPLVLLDSIAVRNHSLDGFAWGYSGSGPSQLALGILMELLPLSEAKQYYHPFKDHFVASWPMNFDFEVTINLEEWLDKHKS